MRAAQMAMAKCIDLRRTNRTARARISRAAIRVSGGARGYGFPREGRVGGDGRWWLGSGLVFGRGQCGFR